MLTKRQKQVLDYIKSFSKRKGYAPSLEEIKKYLKLTSVSTAHHHVQNLIKRGYLNKENNQPRAIELRKSKSSNLIRIPLKGFIAAGEPIEAIEENDYLEIPKGTLKSTNSVFALRVRGDSMIEEGIFDGDLVIIKKQDSAADGQTVVAIINHEEATLKRFYREKNRFRLQPANQKLLPIYTKELEIRGIVVKVIREFAEDDSGGFLLKIIQKKPFTLNSHRSSTTKLSDKPKPFLQWVGGKREMISQYKEFIPKKYNNYFEPFLGGGAMFFYLNPRNAVLSDNNTELIRTYEGVRDDPEGVIKILKELKSRHSKDLYQKIREVDREIDIFKQLGSQEIAARMIYLNQTCFNGLYRVNKKGQFNVPIGSSLNRLICDENSIRNVSKVLKNTVIKESDFQKVLKTAKKNDLIYLDPPYFPVSKHSDFTRYTKEKFFTEDQVTLKNEVDRLHKIGCKVMVSNSDCNFISNLYSDYKIHKVHSSRSLNCKKDKRGKVSELLITNY